jgi:[ribosomal protein S5]-alanine N-acetyltransferase
MQKDLQGISLEARTTAHAEELYSVLVDPNLYAFLDELPPQSVDALRQKLARSESRKSPDGLEHWLNWVVRDAPGQMIGYVQTTIYENGEANLAYVIGSAHWGRGLAYRAVEQMIRIVAAEFGVKKFFIVSERANARSLHLAERLGFKTLASDTVAQKNLTPSEVLLCRLEK